MLTQFLQHIFFRNSFLCLDFIAMISLSRCTELCLRLVNSKDHDKNYSLFTRLIPAEYSLLILKNVAGKKYWF